MAHDTKTRAKARVLYEAGNSFADISEKLPVSIRSLKDWCRKGNWEKGKAAPKLHQVETDAAIRAAADAGLTKAKVSAKVAQLMDAKKPVYWQGVKVEDIEDNGTQVSAASLGADILGMKKVIVDPSDEFRTFWGGLKGARA